MRTPALGESIQPTCGEQPRLRAAKIVRAATAVSDHLPLTRSTRILLERRRAMTCTIGPKWRVLSIDADRRTFSYRADQEPLERRPSDVQKEPLNRDFVFST